jgi:hypothetical protein
MASTTSVARINDKRNEKKYFSLGEARRALVLVRRVTSDIQNTQANRLKLHAAIALGAGKLKPMHMERLQNEFEVETERLETLIEELTKIGVELKDPSRGLLDFPGMFEGREILFCWKADEETITHWHEVEGGFAGRKSVALMGG